MTWTAEARWAVPTAVGVVLFGVGLSLLVQVPLPAVVAVVVSVVVVQFRRITVTVDKTHLRTAFGFPGWVRVRIPLADIERLEYVPDLRPVRYGGWGYRGSLQLLKKAAVILRRGPGVIFALTGDRRYIVTVDDAETLAEVVQSRLTGA
ncbi:MAG: hypothetical protein ABWZ14_08060 [Acidimicrobiales bacterium]